MKWLKRLGGVFLFLPVMLVVVFVAYEVFGMCMNHIATQGQTDTLQSNLENEISDIEIVNVHSETGNMSGTGNHVDCLSSITFSTEVQESEIESRLSKYYVFDGWECCVRRADDGYYMIQIITSAPFSDNIEGH